MCPVLPPNRPLPDPKDLFFSVLAISENTENLQVRTAELQDQLREQLGAVSAAKDSVHNLIAANSPTRVGEEVEKATADIRAASARYVATVEAYSSQARSWTIKVWRYGIAVVVVTIVAIISIYVFAAKNIPSLDEVERRKAWLRLETYSYADRTWIPIHEEAKLCGGEPRRCGSYGRID